MVKLFDSLQFCFTWIFRLVTPRPMTPRPIGMLTFFMEAKHILAKKVTYALAKPNISHHPG